MTDVDALLELVFAEVSPLPAVPASIVEATGRVLAADVVAVDPSPPFTNSAMDGYAVRRADLAGQDGSGTALRVVDDVPAGVSPARRLLVGEAASIATGGMVPPGADVVVPIEQTSRDGEFVMIEGALPDHGHFRPAGDDVRPGSVVGLAGQLVTDRLVALAMAVGVRTVHVVPRPRVGVLTTGDELLPLGAPLSAGKVRDVNGLLLRSALTGLGFATLDMATATDEVDELTGRLDDAASAGRLDDAPSVDAIVVAGGLGKGRRDVLTEAIGRSGTVRAFEVSMRPGKPIAFGQVGGVPIFGVPGNPVAAVVALHVIVAPALRRMAGRRRAARPVARITETIATGGGRRHYLRVRLAWMDGALVATPVGHRGSASVSSLAAADGLLEIPETIDAARAGESFGVIPFEPREGW